MKLSVALFGIFQLQLLDSVSSLSLRLQPLLSTSIGISRRSCSSRGGHYQSVVSVQQAVSGADIEQDTPPEPKTKSTKKSLAGALVPGADIEQDGPTSSSSLPNKTGGQSSFFYRGKVNEVDYCIAPADVSLSRAYSQTNADTNNKDDNTSSQEERNPMLSLTRALNNASNRAVRRILLVRCWPSSEALNLSLRLAAAAEKQAFEEREKATGASAATCPVPRPILNLLMRRGDQGGSSDQASSRPRSRTNEEYVADQIKSFRERYGELEGYNYAEAYLESVLSLATSGEESPRVKEVMESQTYSEPYQRIIAVIKSVGAMMEEDPLTGSSRLSDNLNDQDICLSMMDKIAIARDEQLPTKNTSPTLNTEKVQKEQSVEVSESESDDPKSGSKKRKLRFWMKETDDDSSNNAGGDVTEKRGSGSDGKTSETATVVLSANEPTMTRQLNSLSNIVLRVLLFGGDQELLVLSETLASNTALFVDRWYPGTGGVKDYDEETRPGVQYLNALVMLLRKCYDNGVVTSFEPFVPLIQSYSNSYERLLGSTVELGSGYVRPTVTTSTLSSMPKPRTAQEELGRFAVWESNFRSMDGGNQQSSHPEDLEGVWEVKDEVGGETIGVSTVVFEPQGMVLVKPPMQGLRWRLDPGPTHLDTCTFQVLGEDGTVLQYRGFIDRGARLEARISKRSINIRGSVMFQMRDGEIAAVGEDYWKDMLPFNYKTGTTKFVMKKIEGKSV